MNSYGKILGLFFEIAVSGFILALPLMTFSAQTVILQSSGGANTPPPVAVDSSQIIKGSDQSREGGLVPCGDEVYPVSRGSDGKLIPFMVNDKDVSGQIKNPCNFSHVLALINNITNFFIITGAAVSALAFGYAGFLMMTAAGEMGKIEEAKSIFGKVLVGLLFMLSAWLIVHAIEAAFLDTSSGKFKSLLG